MGDTRTTDMGSAGVSGTGAISTSFSGSESGTQAGSPPGFLDIVPEAYRERPFIKDFSKADKPLEALLDGYENLQKKIGERSAAVTIPGDDATPEAKAAFFKALGVPDAPDGYEYQAPDISKEPEQVRQILEAEAGDKSFMDAMRKVAHEVGVPPKAFAKLAAAVDQWKIESTRQAVEAAAQAGAEQQKKFNEYYGDKAEQVKRIAKETLEKVIPKEIRDIGDPDIALFEAMRYINEKVFKADTVSSGTNSGAPAYTAQELHDKIMKLRDLPEYNDKWHPQHKAITAQVDKLYEQLVEARKA